MRPCGKVNDVNQKYVSNMFVKLLRLRGVVDAKLAM